MASFKTFSKDALLKRAQKRTLFFLFFFIRLYASWDVAQGSEPCLTLDRAIRIALDANPQARAAEEGVWIAYEEKKIQEGAYYPHLGVEAGVRRFQQHIFLPTFPLSFRIPSVVGPIDDWNLALSGQYTLYDSGERRSRWLAALAQNHIAAEEREKAQEELALQVGIAFYKLLAAQQLREAAKENFFNAQRHLELAEERYRAGSVTQRDVVQAKTSVSNSRFALARIENDLRLGAGNLNTLMGLPPHFCLALTEEKNPLPVLPNPSILEPALERALCFRPEARQARQRIRSAYFKTQEAKSSFGPKIHIEGLYGRRDDQFFPKDPEWSIGVSLRWSLFNGFADRHRQKREEKNVRKEQNLEEFVALQIQQDVWNAYSQWIQAHELTQTAIDQTANAREDVKTAEERYLAGAGAASDLLDAQVALWEAESRLAQAKFEYRSAELSFYWSQGLLWETLNGSCIE